jgi:hypothetical protein
MSFSFGRPSCGTRLALRFGRPTCGRALRLQLWGAQLADVPCIALGCLGQTNLGEAILKSPKLCGPKFVLIHPPAHLLA